MAGIGKERNTFYITHSGELLIWLIIILIIISISTFVYIAREKNDNSYDIFMQDVDGLIVGSPVRMMGIEVGHVTKIKPTNSEVYVKFIITDDTVTIPQGTKATVEFSGMAGSKSLELYLPDKNTYIDTSVPILTVNPPKRLHDALGLLNDMFDKLGSIIYTSSSFSNNLKKIDIKPSNNDENITDFLNYADNLVENAVRKAEKFGNDINKGNKNETKFKNNIQSNS